MAYMDISICQKSINCILIVLHFTVYIFHLKINYKQILKHKSEIKKSMPCL